MLYMQKVGRNFSLPPPVNEVFNELTSGLGEKQKWTVVTSAILLYLSLPKDERQRQIKKNGNRRL